eukprot:CAMPEP_0178430934 /NCGR_PEP_ID=MMETSP0689_2-20121128/31577_1 /TAXON_ID=160604 /ORGANISM="Amphidinium massartii, Strain CS-259" /LENGTH=190 /DNA_ID=CAMNT_0020052809 /DNA_START=147 /DNA_END=716 /DNA_ORIENTATION=+
MKLIFLDIDGVLVTHQPGIIEGRLLSNLKRLVDATGAEIVLSSDWRRAMGSRIEAENALMSVGLTILDCTPSLSPFPAQRPTEILKWSSAFLQKPDAEHISHWVVIDDRPLLMEQDGGCLCGHFVRTQPLMGLTDDLVEECQRVLMEDNGDAEPENEPNSPDGMPVVHKAQPLVVEVMNSKQSDICFAPC